MGRRRTQHQHKQQNQKLSRMEEDGDDDSSSTCSTSVSSELMGTPKMEELHDEEALLEGFVEALYQKRTSTREAALKGLARSFTGSLLVDFAEQKYETLSYLCVGCVRKGSVSETALAARVLGLLVLTLGGGVAAERVFADASSHLVKVSKLASDSATRIAAIESLAILGFVCNTGSSETIGEVMDIFWQIGKHAGNSRADQTLGIHRPSPAVKAAAISSWALLLSCLPSSYIFTHNAQMCLTALASFLETADLEVQTAAGEAIALIFEAESVTQNTAGEDEPWNSESSAVVKPLKASEAQVVEQMKALSLEAGGRGSSRKDKSAQRSSFRELFASIKAGMCAETCIKLRHGDVVRVDTWEKTLQLNALRKFLAEGFQIHMHDNDLLHDIFNFTPRQHKQQSLSAKEKRLFHSPNSIANKMRTQARNLRRSIAHAGNMGQFSCNENDVE